MGKEWITGREGKNLKFKRETLLNWAMNRWGFNKEVFEEIKKEIKILQDV